MIRLRPYLAKAMLASCAASLCLATPARAADALPDIEPGFVPTELDERGLWMQSEEYERKLAKSQFVIRDKDLNAYVHGLLCKISGDDACKQIRVYIVRTPHFNASMAPNGAMVIWSGLLLRTRDEAQLVAVLGHEYTHYRKRHGLLSYRSIRSKTDAMAWLGFVPFGFLAQLGVVGSIFSYNRDMEREADAVSVSLMAKAGYDPMAASQIWEQLRSEMDATALARKQKSRKDKDDGMFATHPPSAERVVNLKALGGATKVEGEPYLGRDSYKKALAGWWPIFVDDQIKLNDFGGTEMLLEALALEGWSSDLLFARGELYRSRGQPADLASAAGFYKQAIDNGDAIPEAWRGLGLSQMRSGDRSAGAASLRHYLTLRPEAFDRPMIESIIGGS